MNDVEAIKMLEKLESFMRDTTEQIKILILRTDNLKVDVEKLKKEQNKNRILVAN